MANAENARPPPLTAGAPNAFPPNALVVVVVVEDWPNLLWLNTNPPVGLFAAAALNAEGSEPETAENALRHSPVPVLGCGSIRTKSTSRSTTCECTISTGGRFNRADSSQQTIFV